jgi:hypothetical protein
MALAHMVDAPGFEDYTSFFTKMANDGAFVMLDTGLIEGNARPIEELVEKAKLIGAQEMILNDVFQDHAGTLDSTWEALAYVKKHHPNIRTMAVPQGHNFEDWVACAKELCKWPVDTIGVPKILTKLTGDPHARLKAITAIQDVIGEKEIHLLGCWENPLELKIIENYIRQGKIKAVRGVDSAIAWAYSTEGLRITEDVRPQDPIDFKATTVDDDLLSLNIGFWKHECHGKVEDSNIKRIF